jgi:hypothetical protein
VSMITFAAQLFSRETPVKKPGVVIDGKNDWFIKQKPRNIGLYPLYRDKHL